MKHVPLPPGVAFGLGLAAVAVLPALIAVLGACPPPAVDPTLAFAEAAGAFSVLAAHGVERRTIVVPAVEFDQAGESGTPMRSLASDLGRRADHPHTDRHFAGLTPLRL